MSEIGEGAEPKLRFTRRSPFARSRKLCPRCLQPLSGRSKLGGWLVPQLYLCPACGYTGSVFLEKSANAAPSEDPLES